MFKLHPQPSSCTPASWKGSFSRLLPSPSAQLYFLLCSASLMMAAWVASPFSYSTFSLRQVLYTGASGEGFSPHSCMFPSASRSPCFSPWCQLNSIACKWEILGAITFLSLHVLQPSTALKRAECFERMGLLPLPQLQLIFALDEGWKGPPPEQVSVALRKIKSALGHGDVSCPLSNGRWLLLWVWKEFKT